MEHGMTMANLFYVIGASGAGKDSLIHYIRERMPVGIPVVFAHRYITRPADAGGENHVALNEREFLLRLRSGCYAMNWFSHETHYGIGTEINAWLAQGLDVVVNGSRAYLGEAAKLYPNLVPVLISVNPEVLRERLLIRGRETSEQVNQRLLQANQVEKELRHPHLLKVDNNELLQNAGESLLNAIHERVRNKCA